jgi:hypothetical protein
VVDHTTYEHTSILRFVSENWGLPYLTLRHRSTTSIEAAFGGFATYRPDPQPFTPYESPPELALEPTVEPVAPSDLHALAATGWFDALPVDTDARFEDSFLRER